MGTLVKETLTFVDDDIARFMEEAAARRGRQPPPPPHQAGKLRERVPGHRPLHRRAEAPGRVLLRAGRRVRPPTHADRPGRLAPPVDRIHERRHRWAGPDRAPRLRYSADAASARRRARSPDRNPKEDCHEGSQDRRRRARDHPRRAHRHPARGAGRPVRLAQADRGGRRGDPRARRARASDRLDPATPPTRQPGPPTPRTGRPPDHRRASECPAGSRRAGPSVSPTGAATGSGAVVMVFWAGNFIVVKAALTSCRRSRSRSCGSAWRPRPVGAPALARRHAPAHPARRRPAVRCSGRSGSASTRCCGRPALGRSRPATRPLLIAATPVLTALFAAAIGSDTLTRPKLVGGVVSFAGVVAVVGAGAGLDFGRRGGRRPHDVACRRLLGDVQRVRRVRSSAPLPVAATAWATVAGTAFLAVPGLFQLSAVDDRDDRRRRGLLAVLYSGALSAGDRERRRPQRDRQAGADPRDGAPDAGPGARGRPRVHRPGRADPSRAGRRRRDHRGRRGADPHRGHDGRSTRRGLGAWLNATTSARRPRSCPSNPGRRHWPSSSTTTARSR